MNWALAVKGVNGDQIFLADLRTNGGIPRGPRGPKSLEPVTHIKHLHVLLLSRIALLSLRIATLIYVEKVACVFMTLCSIVRAMMTFVI